MNQLSNETWARLISVNPDKEDLHLSVQSNQLPEYQANSEWKIYQKSSRETWILNLSASNIRVDKDLLEINQEKRLSGGEKIAFCKEKKDLDLSFDFVFCLTNFQENELKRPRDEGLEPILPLAAEKLVKKEDLNEDPKCPICLGAFQNCVTLDPCHHSFCSECLFNSFRTSSSSTCPECRTKAVHVGKVYALRNYLPTLAEQKSYELTELSGEILVNEKGAYVGSLSVDRRRREGFGRFGDKKNSEIYDGTWKDDKKEGKGILILNGKIFKGEWSNDVMMESNVSIVYPNGEKYEGETQNFKKHGKGILKFSESGHYDGNFKEDLRDGFGKRLNSKGKYGIDYEGNWVKGSRNGFGISKSSDGRIYKGEWKENKRHGKGLCTFSNGNVYEGSYVEGQKSGVGKFVWANGEEYEGSYEADQRNGNGTMKYQDGGIYKGDWKDGKRNGKGVLALSNGDKYEGDWANDVRNGQGKFVWKDGCQYEGNWVNDLLNGYGTMEYADKSVYKGNWKDNKKEKDGVLTKANGDQFEGIWVNDVIQPEVKIKYLNGDVYEGEIEAENFLKQGKGVFISSHGDQYNGSWFANKPHGQGRKTWREDKLTYEGAWEDGRMSGDGVMTYEDGTQYKTECKKI